MKLLALDLLRYGHLTDVRLRFDPARALHVVLGGNEAGKSTALSAIGDALFDFPHNTDYAFLHDTGKLRIGFEVMAADGTRAAFLRRKGRKDPLMTSDETPVPEAALQRFLGGAGRELFRTAFGLNGATLRDGATSLIEAGGAAGENLLAGMGLPHLAKVRDRLERAAGELHGDRRGNRRLPAAAEAWHAAQKAMDAAAVRPAEWQEAEAALERIATDLATLNAEDVELKREQRRLHRAVAVAPILDRLDRARAARAALGEVPALPPAAEATLARLAAALDKATEDAQREEAAAEACEAKLAALPRDAAALAAQDALDALARGRVTAEAALRDLPAQQRQAREHRDQVLAAAARLGEEGAPEALRDRLPPPRLREAAQRLLRGRTQLQAKLDAAAAARATARRKAERAQEALAAAAAPQPAAPLRRLLDAVRAEGPLDRELALKTREAVEAAAKRDAALSALDLWTGDAAALAACRLPLPALADAAAARMEQAAKAVEDAARNCAAIGAEIATLDAALDRLAAGGTVPTREVIDAARAHRDAIWQALRAVLDGAPPDAALPARFEAARDEADALADARAEDAERVNLYATTRDRREAARAEALAAAAARDAAEAAQAEAQAAWRDLWAPAGVTPHAPAAMRQWRDARQKVLDLAETAAATARARDEVAARREEARARLLPALPGADPGATLAALLAAGDAACDAAEAAEAAHRRLRDTARAEAERLEEALEAEARAAAALAEADGGWRPAIAALGLAETATVEEVEAALSAWGAVAEAATGWRVAEGRIAEMQAAIDGFGAAASALAATLGEAPGEMLALAARLARRLAAARAAEVEAAGLQRQAAERRDAAAAARLARDAAAAELARLHEAAGTEALEALAEVVRRAAEAARLDAAIAADLAALAAPGEGRDEAALRAEVDGFDLDAARLRLDAIEQRQQELGERRTQLGAERQAAQHRLAALEAGRDAAGHALDAQLHLAEAQAAAERYARLHLARRLLAAGIETLRQDRQGPMLRAAAAHFALLTGGRYQRLAAQEDDRGATVLLAIRADGTDCPMEALSEGTRDQLFLALRVAAIEDRARAAEPLPFIADDLLASFDDGRAEAALALLARLGASTQVILFTHHAHIAALAARRADAEVIPLPGAEAAQAAA
jgi:uncharacterized protein YhaN